MNQKQHLRAHLRQIRKDHVASLPASMRGLVFHRPPALVADLLPSGGAVGLYAALGSEAPALGYARWLHENGRTLALPCFADRNAAMQFRIWQDPWDDEALVSGPFGLKQPGDQAALVTPDALIVPLLGFTAQCQRIGQGAGHYDRWLADHPGVTTVGLAWDCQLVDSLPLEPHDQPLHAVVTPTRIYERA